MICPVSWKTLCEVAIIYRGTAFVARLSSEFDLTAIRLLRFYIYLWNVYRTYYDNVRIILFIILFNSQSFQYMVAICLSLMRREVTCVIFPISSFLSLIYTRVLFFPSLTKGSNLCLILSALFSFLRWKWNFWVLDFFPFHMNN